MEYDFYREDGDSIYLVETLGEVGEFLFSFDKKTVFNFWTDYPDKLTPEQVELFRKEQPMMAALKDPVKVN